MTTPEPSAERVEEIRHLMQMGERGRWHIHDDRCPVPCSRHDDTETDRIRDLLAHIDTLVAEREQLTERLRAVEGERNRAVEYGMTLDQSIDVLVRERDAARELNRHLEQSAKENRDVIVLQQELTHAEQRVAALERALRLIVDLGVFQHHAVAHDIAKAALAPPAPEGTPDADPRP